MQDTRVGDTVTLANNPTPEALPGYRQVKPMVFCGIYPADGAKYPDLKDALEKLQLNDASLTFELETSAALGFGFRCGFLGLLHMEIITERLEREFDLDLITTTPSVRYRLTLTDGTVEMIDNPSSYPDPSNIVKQEEPFVDVHLYTPNEYVGSLMDLCQNKRGVLIDMKSTTSSTPSRAGAAATPATTTSSRSTARATSSSWTSCSTATPWMLCP